PPRDSLGLVFGAAQGFDLGGETAGRSGAVVDLPDPARLSGAPVEVGPFAALLPGHRPPHCATATTPAPFEPSGGAESLPGACQGYAIPLNRATTVSIAGRSTSPISSGGAPASASVTLESVCSANSAAGACRTGCLRSHSCNNNMI